MDRDQRPDSLDPDESQEEEEGDDNGLDWLLREPIVAAPMDTLMVSPVDAAEEDDRQNKTNPDSGFSKTFSRERVFEAASQGDPAQLDGLLDHLRIHNQTLTSPEFIDEKNGKTALLKALLNLKNGKNDTVEVLLDIAEKTGDLENLVNASYKDPFYKGQTALHIAIERRSFDHVQLLVQKGADVQAKANGKFFQRKAGLGFYFGELPLSLAACTNQPDVVAFLMKNPHRRADLNDRDSQGNTVLHALVVIADNTEENTDMIAQMYDEILIQHNRLQDKSSVQLEDIKNNRGLTPLKLAAKLGKVGLLRHMLHREFVDEEMKPLSRKFTEWVYGPVHSSLYDTSSVDTNEHNSVLEIVVWGSDTPNRPEMLQIEPLRSLLQDKWDRFASKLFLMNFLVYVSYLTIFTVVAFYRKEGKPPFPFEELPVDAFRCIGEIISVLGAVWFFYKAITSFKRNPPTFKGLYTDGFSYILTFLQSTLLLVSAILYFCGRKAYVGLLVLSLAFAWINVLYYSRGSKQMGMYNVTMERMILCDLFHFLCYYGVLFFGFSAAIVALMTDPPPKKRLNRTMEVIVAPAASGCAKPSYSDIRFTTLEMFKFTIGMGNLEFTDHVQYKEVFYILLILYIVLTYILLLNMLIAVMGNTVEIISKESENIWNLQRACTILDMERTLPRCLTNRLFSAVSNVVCFGSEKDESRRFFRVEEMNWKKWRSDVGVMQEEGPEENLPPTRPHHHTARNLWRHNPLLERIRARRRHPHPAGIP